MVEVIRFSLYCQLPSLKKITMKYLSSIICLVLCVSFIPKAQAQSLPSAQEIGVFFGKSMCTSLIAKGNINDEKVMEQFTEDLVLKYGEQTTLELLESMEFSEKSLKNDDYEVNLMKAAFSHIINDDNCFKIFLEQVFLE